MECILALCCLVAVLFRTCESASIVSYIPLPFYSHQAAFNPLWIELAKRGHKITLIQSNSIIKNNENITHITLDETYKRMEEFKLMDMLGEGQSLLTILLFKGQRTFGEVVEYQLTHPGIQELLRGEKKVDLFFTEYLTTLGFDLGKKLNAPMIGLVSMDGTIHSHTTMGNPTHPLLYPDKDLMVSSDTNFKQRVISSLFWLGFWFVDFVVIPMQEKLTKQYLGANVTNEEAIRDASLVFINANPLFNSVRPLGPKTVNIGGGVHIMASKALSKELQDYLDNSKNGVIYFSLGSSITSKQLNHQAREVILKTFSRLPYDILWKFEEDLPGKSKNVKIMKWLPQQDILRHKNIKLFITQGGLQSMEEAIFSYVPMVALPFYGDQPNNAQKMVAKGFGLMLDHNKLDVKSFEGAILEVVDNPKYRETTKRLADLVMDQPMTGLEKAVWWTEYVLRHGRTDHFRNPGIDMPWYQFLFVDVICFFLAVIGVFVYALFKVFQLLKWSIRKLYTTLVKKKKTKTN